MMDQEEFQKEMEKRYTTLEGNVRRQNITINALREEVRRVRSPRRETNERFTQER